MYELTGDSVWRSGDQSRWVKASFYISVCSLGEKIGVGQQTDFKNSTLRKVEQLSLAFNIPVWLQISKRGKWSFSQMFLNWDSIFTGNHSHFNMHKCPPTPAPTQFGECQLERSGNLPLSRVTSSVETQLLGQWESTPRHSGGGGTFTIGPPHAWWYVNAY